MSETPCPLPTPELVAALANQFIEARRHDGGDLRAAFQKIIGEGSWVTSDRHAMLWNAAMDLATALSFPAPYECVIRLADGRELPAERHTITFFTDTDGFEAKDWAAISALDVGESYLINGHTLTMTVTRKE